MPTCSETYGEGWVGDYPNCIYDPSDFSGTPESLDYGEDFEGTTLEGDEWQEYFDPYDPTKEEMRERFAGIDVGQLGEAWDLAGKHLGESWGLKKEELGAGTRAGLGQVKRASSSARRKFGGAFSGTITGAEIEGEEDIMASYRRSFGLGKSVYEQAMETGELNLRQGTTDIYQGLEAGVYGDREAWETGQRGTLDYLLQSGDINLPPEPEPEGPPLRGREKKMACYRNCDGQYKWYDPMRAVCRGKCEAGWG